MIWSLFLGTVLTALLVALTLFFGSDGLLAGLIIYMLGALFVE